MFPALRLRIALGFTITIFVLLLVQGSLLIYFEYQQDMRRVDGNLAEEAQQIIGALGPSPKLSVENISSLNLVRSRLYRMDKTPFHTGAIYLGKDTGFQEGTWILPHRNYHYRIRTFPITSEGEIMGYIQIGDVHNTLTERFRNTAMIFVLQSIALSVLAFIIGIWFEKRTMKPLQRMVNQLEQFTQNVGHELKTPLANAKSSLELALVSKKDRDITVVIKDVNRIDNLIEGLLQLTTLDKNALLLQATNTSSLTGTMLQEYSPECANRSIELISDIQPDVIRMADAILVRIVVRNLLCNAIKFTKNGGEIQVILTTKFLEVRDNGVGIAPDVLENIFQPFFQADTSRSTEGFGLGLAIVKRIIELHEWKTEVRSELGKGTVFTVRF